MKRKLIAFLLAVSTLFAAGCVNSGKTGETKGPDTAEPTAEPMPTQIKESEVDAVTSRWVCTELAFVSSTDYGNKAAFDIIMDVVFTNRASGTTLKIPAFYDGNNTFKVRFAPTEYGIWDAKTECAEEPSLNGITNDRLKLL